jgi:acetyl esterase/lipase
MQARVLAAAAVIATVVGASAAGVAAGVLSGPPPEEVPAGCRTVVYTPPSASSPQEGDLCRPADQRSTTALLLVHGGGGFGGHRGDLVAWADRYDDAGIVTFNVDYRLLDPDVDDDLYPLPEQNLKAAIQYLRVHGPELGIDRIVVQGHSAGARLGAIVLTTADDPSFEGPELWPDVSTAADGFIGFYGYYDGTQFAPDRYYGGDGAADPSARPVEAPEDATGPVLLFHGDQDALVPAWQSEAFALALLAAGRDVRLVTPPAPHGFDGYASPTLTGEGEAAFDRILVWLG